MAPCTAIEALFSKNDKLRFLFRSLSPVEILLNFFTGNGSPLNTQSVYSRIRHKLYPNVLPLFIKLLTSKTPPIWSLCQWVTIISRIVAPLSLSTAARFSIYSGLPSSPESRRIRLEITLVLYFYHNHKNNIYKTH